MKSTFKPRSLTRSIMALFGTKKGVNPHIRYPDAYYRRVYFDKQMFNGIELVAKIENKDTKVAEHDLMEQALTEYMAKQTRLQVRRELEAIADGEPLPKPSHFTKELRKLAAERGMKI